MIKTQNRSVTRSYRTRVLNEFGVISTGQFQQTMHYEATRQTENSPDWRRRIKLGLNATGFLNGTDVVIQKSPASATLRLKVVDGSKARWHWYDGDPLWLDPYYPGAVSTPLVVSADNMALTEFIQRIRAAQTKVMTLVMAGEAGKTCLQLVNAGRQIESGLYALMRDTHRRLKREPRFSGRRKNWLGITSDLWLAYVYGITPVLEDIKGLAKARALNGAAQNPRIFVQGKGKSTARISQSRHTLDLNGVTVWANSAREAFADCKYFGCVRAALPNTTNQAALLAGYDWSNVLPSMWELIPYSFVADYFTNMSEILSAFSLNASTVNWVARTHRYGGRHFCESSQDVTLKTSDDYTHYSPFQLNVETRNVDRRALDSVPVPGLVFSLPGSRQTFNLAALAAAHTSYAKSLR